MSGVVVWITGVPSCGKSTLAGVLAERIDHACILDGDAVRAALVPRPGYDPASRDDFYATLGNLAALVARQGLVVLVPATAHRAAYRAHARGVAPAFIEVFVDIPREEAERRDAKGLYRAVKTGKVTGVPGADLDYERPEAPDARVSGRDDILGVERVLAAIREKR